MDLYDDLEARGLVHTATEGLRDRLAAGPITVYHGMDPSADSLHTGNLIGLLMLRRFQLAGHRPIALAGGATGMVGDPGGRSEERNLLDEDTLRANVAAIKEQIARVLGDDGEWELVDNYDWTRDLPLLAFLRDVGKHVTVNQMMARESVRTRIESEHGISYTEFSYMLLQANDYWWLHAHRGCELQIGGSDQWGNIVQGVDLVRRRSAATVHALSWPLLLAPDGSKLGKTTGARTWLAAAKTSPYQLYQHFIQTDDADVARDLRWLTLLPVEQIDEVVERHQQAPQRREAQRTLAREVVALVHGPADAAAAEAASRVLFGAPLAEVDEETMATVAAEVPSTTVDVGHGVELADLLTETGLAASKSEATRIVKQGGAYVNNEKWPAGGIVGPDQQLHGRYVLLRRGKDQYH